ncbi:hypothetical protein PFISCL1PPCAC_20331, partial [Pristionchus fissidentatus]
MNSLCPNGTVNLGFIGDYFPIFFQENGRMKGISYDLFKDVAARFNCSSLNVIEFHTYSTLAFVQRGEILTDITTSALSNGRMKMFHYSLALYVDTYSFYEATNQVMGEAWTPLQFFIVFKPFPLLLIGFSLILIHLITSMNRCLRTTLGLWVKKSASSLFLFSIMFIIFLHGAVFKGNTIYPIAPVLT